MSIFGEVGGVGGKSHFRNFFPQLKTESMNQKTGKTCGLKSFDIKAHTQDGKKRGGGVKALGRDLHNKTSHYHLSPKKKFYFT